MVLIRKKNECHVFAASVIIGCGRRLSFHKKALLVVFVVLWFYNTNTNAWNGISLLSSFSSNVESQNNKTTISTTTTTAAAVPNKKSPAQRSFENLELFVSAFPGDDDNGDNNSKGNNKGLISGFVELKMTLIRSLQFFWPKDQFKMTFVLDKTVYTNQQEKEAMTARVKNLFHNDAFSSNVKVQYNPLVEKRLYGGGWMVQQLIMLWADNFTDAEYIGFVDDDTAFTRVVQAHDLFDDESGHPRAIVKHATSTYFPFATMTNYAFGWPTVINGMNFFPVIIHRNDLANMREAILQHHAPKFKYFDEFYAHIVNFGRVEENAKAPCQFCMILDYIFHNNNNNETSSRSNYKWHFEESVETWGKELPVAPKEMKQFLKDNPGVIAQEETPQENGVTLEMLEPFPRVAVHVSYMNIKRHQMKEINLMAYRRKAVNRLLRTGYCYSLPPLSVRNLTSVEEERCRHLDIRNVTNSLHIRGAWKFEYMNTYWLKSNKSGVIRAHAESMARNPSHHPNWEDGSCDDEFAAIFDPVNRPKYVILDVEQNLLDAAPN